MNSLAKLVEQFIYTHMNNVPYRRELIELVANGELAYTQRIRELEVLVKPLETPYEARKPSTPQDSIDASPHAASLRSASSEDPVSICDDEYMDTRYWGMD